MHRLFASLRLRSRQRRYRTIEALSKVESVSGLVLDLGGGPGSFFASLFPKPSQVVLIDLIPAHAIEARAIVPDLLLVVADGERLPLADRSIASVVCNSVIEHVQDPQALAGEIRRVSRSYFVQTPNGNFFLEPHSFVPIPFYRVIPWARLRRLLCTLFAADYDYLESVHYLGQASLARLFPEATIAYESYWGFKKSLYLYRAPDQESGP